LGNKLITAPITTPNRVLDLGTGTGIWCIDFADEHPEADVKGIDLSPSNLLSELSYAIVS
jgi:ubiquinone/menaquinone biosynthesis C-methylase UbiE